MLKTDQYYELDEDIRSFFKTTEQEFVFAMDLKYIFQTNTKQKCLITIKKIPDNFAVLLNAEVIVTINEDYFNKFDDKIRRILFEQELDKIEMNLDKGTFKIVQSILKTSFGIVNKYTYKEVERANETERLIVQNKEEQD